MAKNIAWSPISLGGGKVIPVGEEVTAAKLGDGGKEMLEEFIEAGAVRDEEYPETNDGEPPRTALIRQATEQMDKAMGGNARKAPGSLDDE